MIGTQIREYVFQKLLGEGGMGAVYLAEHTHLRQRRAIKLLHRELTQQQHIVERFVNEARAVSMLKGRDGKPHRNLIQVYELFQENGTWFMVMEHLEGSTLANALERGPMPLDRIVDIVGGIANALKIAHANGIIHRDLKPDNVFLAARENNAFNVVLLDFGVAQLRNSLAIGPATKAGVLIGTLHFMAPEQLAGREITTRTDIFSLGIVAYMMATGGRHPWQYEDAASFARLREGDLYVRMTQQPPVDPRRYAPHLSEEQVQVLVAPLDPDPARRPPTVGAYATALAERTPTDGVKMDGLTILRTRYPELETDSMSQTVRAPKPSMPSLPSSGLESKYKLVRKLGAGGMAEVYLATTLGVEGFARPVAIKRIFAGLSESEAFAKLFIREAQITARLSHPCIVSVLDFSRDPQDRLFLVMEYVDGKDLAAILEAGPLSPSLAIFVTTQILRGLGYAHSLPADSNAPGTTHGVVHRDISPHNVLVSYEGAVKVCDFGLARALAASNTSSTAPVGKPAYMSPEQVSSVPDLDGRSDLFAVGIMLWEMLTGEKLFSGSFTETMAQVMFKDLEPPSRRRHGVPPALDAITMRLLSRDRATRYQHAEDAVRDLVVSGYAPTDGPGELVAALSARFPRSGNATPIKSSSSGGAAAPMFSQPPTVSASPARAMPNSTLGAAASESGVVPAVTPPRNGSPRLAVGLGLAVLIAGGVGAGVATMNRGSKSVAASEDDASTQGSAKSTATEVASAQPVDAVAAQVTATSEHVDAAPSTVVPTPAVTIDAGVTSRTVQESTGSAAVRAVQKVPAPAREKGALSVSCDPWCEIWIDGAKRASTVSKRFTLPVGVHTVRLVYPDTKSELTKKVEISTTPQIIEQVW